MKLAGSISPISTNSWRLQLSWGILIFFVIMSFLAPLLSNENPIYISTKEKSYWPIVSGVNWQKICSAQACETVNTIVPFSATTIDVSSIYAPPRTNRASAEGGTHLLGTDALGRDVLAALIYGTRTAVWVSMMAAGIAFIIGLLYGLIVGYYGDDRMKYSTKHLALIIVLGLVSIMIFLFINSAYAALLISTATAVISYILLSVGFISTWIWILRHSSRGASRHLALDSIGMRIVDAIKALPALFIVLYALQVRESITMWYLIAVIAFLLWPTFARHGRAEVLRLRRSPSVQSAQLTGRSDSWIWIHEILPFMVRPLLVSLAFSMASAVLLEATLSFLGLGLAADHVSWGTLIDAARARPDAWWLLVFPGLCMLALVWSLQHLGRHWESRLRNQQSMRSL